MAKRAKVKAPEFCVPEKVMNNTIAYVVSCEHAGNAVPEPYQHLFHGHEQVIGSHRGYDPGALEAAQYIGHKLGASIFTTSVTRLIIDTNRSLHNPRVFSEFSKKLSKEERIRCVENLYTPYRTKICNEVERLIRLGKHVIHLSIHTFTPQLNGNVRLADIGVLYDPSRPSEKKIVSIVIDEIKKRYPFRIRRNYPYRGISDGLTVARRKEFDSSWYTGLEIELNHGSYVKNDPFWKQMVVVIPQALRMIG